MQGHLRNEALDFLISTTCAQTGRAITIAIDGELNYTVREAGAQPLLSLPQVDFSTLEEPSIINAY